MPKYIGIIGKRAAGKDAFCAYAKEAYGINSVATSTVLGEFAVAQGWMTQDQLGQKAPLQEAGRRIGEDFAPDHLVTLLIEKVRGTDYLIQGIRRLDEPPTLKRAFGEDAIIVGITADTQLRYERALASGIVRDYNHFEKLEGHFIESFIDELVGGADVTITNNGSLEQFHANISNFLEWKGFKKQSKKL